MVVGLIGSGNMARALARGWGEPVLCTDVVRERAEALAAEVGGEAVGSNAELAERAELVVLCHKPAQLEEVAAEVGRSPRVVASILGATPRAAVQAAYPGSAVFRLMPSVPVEVRQGVVCHVPDPDADPDLERQVLDLFGRLGTVFPVEEHLVDVAMGVMSVAPAYVALLVEAQVDAAVKQGLPAPVAGAMFVEVLAGTAALLRARDLDTLAVRREVTSPGGSTARGLAALERGGVRAAFSQAMEAVLGREPS